MSPRRRRPVDPNQGVLALGFGAPPPAQHERISTPASRARPVSITRAPFEEDLEFIPIQSSRVAAAAYNAATDRLYLTWVKPGRPYVYEGVTSEEWRQFRRVKSKGKFVNRRLNQKTYYPVEV